jgi:hypothetical protein
MYISHDLYQYEVLGIKNYARKFTKGIHKRLIIENSFSHRYFDIRYESYTTRLYVEDRLRKKDV